MYEILVILVDKLITLLGQNGRRSG